MRSIPGIVVIDPADKEEMTQAVKAVSEYIGPVYLRETRDEWPDIFDSSYVFKIGKAAVVLKGDDAAIISCGVMTSVALEAAGILKKENVNVRVVNMSTIKPLDIDAVISCAKETGAIVVAENHSIYGGLGSAVAEAIVENYPVPMQRIGIKDVLGEAGKNSELLEKYGMSAGHIAEAVRQAIRRKKS
jgi:transketolase